MTNSVNPVSQLADRPPEPKLSLWDPGTGREFENFIERKKENPAQQAQLRRESPRILGSCVNPTESVTRPSQTAGLVLGYVQSGKTSSFTGVTALAKDNDYDLIVVVAGTSKLLMDQTVNRLNDDLGLRQDGVANRWRLVENPKVGGEATGALQQNLATRITRRQMRQPPNLETPLVVVMKQRRHLESLNEVLRGLGDQEGLLKGLSCLIIDDESHMHTPDISKKNAEDKSRIYTLIKELRSHFGHHTLLQYTATPQANLLCELHDEFRPTFVRLLSVGPDYCGGKKYFLETPVGAKIRSIPKAEQIHLRAAVRNDVAPESLKHAFATFLLLCANDCVTHPEIHDRQRFDMLVHSDMKNNVHLLFDTWLNNLRDNWKVALQDLRNPDTIAERDRYFVSALHDLNQTAQQPMHSLSELFGPPLAEVLDQLMTWLINEKGVKTHGLNDRLKGYRYNVLNGGEMLGVGFTIERLHVSHVIRPPGQKQMDTIQQRGRFFGYRGKYFNDTRIWLEDDVKELFAGYADQESWLRDDLRKYDEQNLVLKNWKVRMRLLPGAAATRKRAVKLICERFEADDEGWLRQGHWISDQRQKNDNLVLLQQFVAGSESFEQFGSLNFRPAEPEFCGRNPDGKDTHHRAASTLDALRQFLGEYITDVRDTGDFEILRTTLDEIHSGENRDLTAIRDLPVDVFYMAKDARVARFRGIEPRQRVSLFQGKNTGVYIGDKNVRGNGITIQIHVVNHGKESEEPQERGVLYIAVCLPPKAKEWAEGWIRQPD